MCGIAGYERRSARAEGTVRLRDALRVIRHRGPDDEGLCFIERSRGGISNVGTPDTYPELDLPPVESAQGFTHDVALGHRRFSIIDVSAAGHQPFWSSDGLVCVAFNGEIYNYKELRHELEISGHRFRTETDTEVLVAAYQKWYLSCFERFNGFWAVSLYDAVRRQVVLSRDRIGKAPLFLADLDGHLYWASEIKAIQALVGQARLTVNEQSLVDFLAWRRRNLFEETVYDEVSSLPAGHWMRIDDAGRRELQRYWSIPDTRADEGDLNLPEKVAEFQEIFSDAVSIRLRADVPVCTQLSGGMDSSTIAAFTAGECEALDVYTVKFDDPASDEEPFAKAVADHYSDVIRYHLIRPPDDDFLQHADDYVRLVEEPFHGPNQFTNHRIWQEMASHGYRVNLYGAGGDEVFAGYPTLYGMPFLTSLLAKGHPVRFLREFASDARFGNGLPALRAHAVPLVRHVSCLLGLSSLASDPSKLPVRFSEGVTPRAGASLEIERRLIDLMSSWQMNYWVRLDNQNCMGVPLELRSPFLDHRVVEFGFRLPTTWLLSGGWPKWFLRVAAEGRLPKGIAWRRRKMGFPFPIQPWLSQHRTALLAMIEGGRCPYIVDKELSTRYEHLRKRDPDALWRVLSIGLWWKRCVCDRKLAG